MFPSGMTRSTASAPFELDVGAGVSNACSTGHLPRLHGDREEDALGGAPLVRGDDVRKPVMSRTAFSK